MRRQGEARKGLSWKEQREYEALEAQIGTLEARKADIEAEMNLHAQDYVRLKRLHEAQEEIEEKLEVAMARWFELEERK